MALSGLETWNWKDSGGLLGKKKSNDGEGGACRRMPVTSWDFGAGTWGMLDAGCWVVIRSEGVGWGWVIGWWVGLLEC